MVPGGSAQRVHRVQAHRASLQRLMRVPGSSTPRTHAPPPSAERGTHTRGADEAGEPQAPGECTRLDGTHRHAPARRPTLACVSPRGEHTEVLTRALPLGPPRVKRPGADRFSFGGRESAPRVADGIHRERARRQATGENLYNPSTRAVALALAMPGDRWQTGERPTLVLKRLISLLREETGVVASYTTVPHTISGVGGADARACAAPPVGGAAWAASAVPTAGTSPPALFHGDLGDAVDGARPDAVPPRRQARYRALRQGFRSHGFLPLPPELVDPDPPLPSSPPYSPPPYSSEDEAPSSGDSAAVIEDSSISSTHDLPPTQEAGNYRTLTLLRAGRPVPGTSSG
ncbi:hypothetical protein CYMTET_54350 [Cymbomonas tetramitiformis]|uniref:Uncharacterized protein n=1 Tax=Cymbomonas tetramitiformis TaxID=36881 RepID=A0AAE0BGH9_9CHLO|nr:hypothetical protein CYMTET_54350 [Cymbomonas tetramitiformis]